MLKIRVLKKEELPLLFKHSYESGLDVEELPISCQYDIHPKDFFIAHKDEHLVGFIVALRHSDAFAYISNFLILKEFRAKGYGTMLFSFALEHLQDKQIALDSSYQNKKIYENFGFHSYFDVHTYLYITQKQSTPLQNYEFINFQNCHSANKTNIYLQCLLQTKDVHYFSLENHSVLSSYGISFPYRDGYKIVIDSQNYAHSKAIFLQLCKNRELGISIYIDATKLNPIFLQLAQELQMIEFSKSARMYNKVL